MLTTEELHAARTKRLLAAYASGQRDFRYTDLLMGSDLCGMNLEDADLLCADLHGALLRGANLQRVNLRNADLREADLRGAVLQGADLSGALLRGADLRGALLRGAILYPSSRNLIAEVLRQAAGNNLQRLMLAGLVLLQQQWCWKDFDRHITDPQLRRWTRKTLSAWPELRGCFVNLYRAKRLASQR